MDILKLSMQLIVANSTYAWSYVFTFRFIRSRACCFFFCLYYSLNFTFFKILFVVKFDYICGVSRWSGCITVCIVHSVHFTIQLMMPERWSNENWMYPFFVQPDFGMTVSKLWLYMNDCLFGTIHLQKKKKKKNQFMNGYCSQAIPKDIVR